jgi:hypothetical protein
LVTVASSGYGWGAKQARVVGMPYGDRDVDVDYALWEIQAANPGLSLMAAPSVLEQNDPALFVPPPPD